MTRANSILPAPPRRLARAIWLALLATSTPWAFAQPKATEESADAAAAESADANSDSAAAAPQAGTRTRQLGTVVARGLQPSSLPTRIPTTFEGISASEIEQKINATDAEDALKYFPSLLVRKRYIGDYDHAVLATRASGTGNSARSLVYADGILISNLLGNGASFTPRWGLVTPEEIERVDVLYGPFSAAYPGNSVGAVVDYITRMPEAFEARAKVGAFTQDYTLYRTDERYSGAQGSASMGSRSGALAWWIGLNRLHSDSHPIVFANRLVSAGSTAAGGTPVTGAVLDRNPRNQPWLLLAATNQTDTTQDHAKLKLAVDLAEDTRLSYVFGAWDNEVFRDSESFLRNSAGQPVYSGDVRIDGLRYSLVPADISQQRADLRHYIHGLTLQRAGDTRFDYKLALSTYDYHRDRIRSPLVARPAADIGGAGRIAIGDGTGWDAAWLSGSWYGWESHTVEAGLQFDRHTLSTQVFDTPDWIRGVPGTRFSAFGGETTLRSFYLQDHWQLAERWTTTLGLRHEHWEARDGRIVNAAGTTLRFAERDDDWVSPKAAVAWAYSPDWTFKASLGRAVRNPTVSELYQGTISTNVILNNDPNLKPERSWTGELSAIRDLGNGTLRTTVFSERTRDALYSQTNVTVTPNVTNIQNVDRIETLGAELAWAATAVFIDTLDLQASLTYADSTIERNDRFPASVGKWQPRVPRWRANLLATWQATDALSLTAGGRYSGTQYNTLDNVDPNGFAYTGTQPLPGVRRAGAVPLR